MILPSKILYNNVTVVSPGNLRRLQTRLQGKNGEKRRFSTEKSAFLENFTITSLVLISILSIIGEGGAERDARQNGTARYLPQLLI